MSVSVARGNDALFSTISITVRSGARVRCDNPLGNDDALARLEREGLVVEIDEQAAFEHVEELILVVVLVPVVFALDHGEAHDRAVDFAQRLVEPLVRAGVGQRFFVDEFERADRERRGG